MPFAVLSQQDQGDLERFFGPAGSSGRSTLGPMLERAEQLYTDSRGQTVEVSPYRTVLRSFDHPNDEKRPWGRLIEAWPTVRPRREQHNPGLDPEERDSDLQLTARLSRRMAQLPPETREALRLLYGDEGCRWGREPKWGRVWALVPFTKAGQKALGRDDEDRRQKGQPEAVLQPAERLRLLAERTPRPGWVDSALDQAEQIRRTVEAAWGSAL